MMGAGDIRGGGRTPAEAAAVGVSGSALAPALAEPAVPAVPLISVSVGDNGSAVGEVPRWPGVSSSADRVPRFTDDGPPCASVLGMSDSRIIARICAAASRAW
jgi:hypothetical protein